MVLGDFQSKLGLGMLTSYERKWGNGTKTTKREICSDSVALLCYSVE